jgi:hypothetical protein
MIRALDPGLCDRLARRLRDSTTGVVALGAGVAGGIVGRDNVDSAMAPLMGGDEFSGLADLRPACCVLMGVSYRFRLARAATAG